MQDIDKLGKKYDIKNVADGYARNFLIPKNLAKPATKSNMKWFKTQKEIEAKKAEEALKKVQELASSIEGLEITIPVKVGEKGELFETVGTQKIFEKLNELGHSIKKAQIKLEEPLNELGEHPVKIYFEHNLEVEIRVIIIEEKISD